MRLITIPFAASLGLLIAASASCSHETVRSGFTKSGLDPDNFKAEYRGDSTALYVLTNEAGAEVCITNFGGRVVSAMMPDKDGNFKDVVLGFDSVQSYFPENNLTDFGSSVGRYANRINQGRFVIDGDTAVLPRNNFGHCLHGGGEMGTLGWQYRVYDAQQPNDSTLILTLKSPDGDNGFPGEMNVSVTYLLRGDNALDITYEGTTTRPTVVTMTNHSYFNLTGDPDKLITDLLLMVNAEKMTPVDSTYMTTGEILAVEGTPFDFRQPKKIGVDIGATDFEQIKFGNGYDHNFVLATDGDIDKPCAELYSPESGILLTVYTTEPGIQVYSGNFLDGTMTGKGGKKLRQRSGVCLETQHYPDSPNKPDWPSTRLDPGEKYFSRTIYKFSIK